MSPRIAPGGGRFPRAGLVPTIAAGRNTVATLWSAGSRSGSGQWVSLGDGDLFPRVLRALRERLGFLHRAAVWTGAPPPRERSGAGVVAERPADRRGWGRQQWS